MSSCISRDAICVKLGVLSSAALVIPAERSARGALQLANQLDPARLPAVGQVDFAVPPVASPVRTTVTVPGNWIRPDHEAGDDAGGGGDRLLRDPHAAGLRADFAERRPDVGVGLQRRRAGADDPRRVGSAGPGAPVQRPQPAASGAAVSPGHVGALARQRVAVPARRLRQRHDAALAASRTTGIRVFQEAEDAGGITTTPSIAPIPTPTWGWRPSTTCTTTTSAAPACRCARTAWIATRSRMTAR